MGSVSQALANKLKFNKRLTNYSLALDRDSKVSTFERWRYSSDILRILCDDKPRVAQTNSDELPYSMVGDKFVCCVGRQTATADREVLAAQKRWSNMDAD